MRTVNRTIKIISAITLFFFCWSFLPIYAAVAFAAESKAQSADPSQSPLAKGGSRGVGQTAGDRFEKALEAIRENVAKADDKTGRGVAATGEIEAIKKQRIEIEKLDVDLKAEFATTEKKLKDTKLSQEILDRHAKFVKHYEANLAELKTNLAGIEQGAGSKGFKEALVKAKAHLEKTKAPSKHVPLDPNNLPNRTVKAKERAPRLKKEEFEKDFPSQKKAVKLASLQAILTTDEHGFTRIKHKPIILADNSPASDVPLQLPRPLRERIEVRGGFDPVSFAVNDFTLNAELNTPNYQIAQTTITPPTADDISETPEVQFTPDIQTLAAQLNHNPVKIYEYVRNNIEYAPTYGSIQGADQCLQSKICNDMDTASLLISLLRVSGIYAHYVYGTVDIPSDKAMNWVGGVTIPNMAGTIFATNGIPVTALISGSTIKYERIEHVWVSAFIDYIPSRGAVQRQGNTWIPLDASYKQYNYTQGIDVTSAVPFDTQFFANQILSTATTNTTDGSVSNVNSALVQQSMQDYQTQVQNYIAQNYPNATVGDVIGKKGIIKQEFGILPETLPYKRVLLGSEFAQVPDSLRATISFSISDPTGASAGLTYNTGMPQITGKKITLSFSPTTSNDQAVIALYASTNSAPSSLPAYMINVKPELRIDGQVVASGAAITMGNAQSFAMSLNEPGIGLSNIDNIIQAGEYFGIELDTGRIGDQNLNNIQAKLVSTKLKLESKQYSTLNQDDFIGDLLYATIVTYFAELDINDEITAQARNLVRYRAPSIGMCSLVANVKEVFGVPISISSKGMMMDIDRIMQAVFGKDGSMDNVKRYMLSSGTRSSLFEHLIPDRLFSVVNRTVQGFSAVKALQLANDSGVPLFTIDQTNINSILPELQVDESIKSDVINAINAGKVVTISKTNVNYNGWNGCGYIIIDPATFAGAYMISGQTSGGLILEAALNMMEHYAVLDAEAAEMDLVYSAPVVNNNDPIWNNSCIKYFHYSEYWYCVGNGINERGDDYLEGLVVIAVGTRITGRFAPLGFAGAVIFSIGLLSLTVEIGNNCRQSSIHC